MHRRALLLSGLAVLAGCASTTPIDPNDESLSVVFGYFDMKDAPSPLEWVSLKKYDSRVKEGEWYSLAARDGLFFHVGIEPGAYQVDKFGGTGGIPLLTRRPFEYDYAAKGRNQTAVRIARPGVYFLGAHRYVESPSGFFENGKFQMQPMPELSEKQLLERLVKAIEGDKELAGYTRQLALVKRRLASL
jgi:hypothetical protein